FDSVYVGHPVADACRESLEGFNRREFIFSLKLNPDSPVVTVFPGSRHTEIERLLTPALDALKILKSNHPEIQAIISAAPHVDPQTLQNKVTLDGVKVVQADSFKLLAAADAALVKSGTSNTQAAFARVPFVMFYSAPRLSEWVVRKFVKLSSYSIVNIVRPDTVTELLQNNVTGQTIADELERLLFNDNKRAEVIAGLDYVANEFASYDDNRLFFDCMSSSDRVVRLIEELVGVTGESFGQLAAEG
ncbi:MAG: hypothetical protein D6719_08625, partial [Candidatus Dadabacteria bacterium]